MKHASFRSPALAAALRVLLLGAALLLFAGAVWWDNAANRGISPRPAQPVPYADVPRGGVNTYNLHAEVVFQPDGSVDPNNNVKRSFELIAAANMHWVRVQFPWEDIEVGGKGNFVDTRAASTGADTWAKYDYIVAEARRNGLELIVRLDTPPDWSRPAALASPELAAARAAGRYPLTGPPDRYEDFGDFVAAVAARYRADLRFFQIWNEPNLPGEWNFRRQDPAELVALLRIARERILAANPNAAIVFPALAPTDGRSDGVNDLEYLQGVYDAGGRELFDIMSVQLYGLGQPPDEHRYVRPGESLLQPIDTKADVGRVVLLREIMERNGDGGKAVWVSELGWNSAPKTLGEAALRWGEPVSEETKGQYLVGAMERAQREWPWMGAMCVWMLRFGGPAPDPRDPTPYFQLVDRDFSPLPAYTALQQYLGANVQLPPATGSWLAALAPLGAGVLVVLSMAALMSELAGLVGAFAALVPRLRIARPQRRPRWATHDGRMLGLLGAALAVLYWGSTFGERFQLPITALGALLFGGLSLLRPDLALLFVPISVPLYLAPKGVWDEEFGLRPSGILFPLHEFVILAATIATGWSILVGGRLRAQLSWLRANGRALAVSLLPAALFAVAGTVGVLVAAERGAALREWRWLIVEPLLFYGLARYWAVDPAPRRRLLVAWLGTGVAVAAIGLLQLTGLDLTALLPRSACFSDRVVLAEGGLRRISSVYCHPNNLGLALGRVWPVLAALALGGAISRRGRAWLLAGALLCLAALGLLLSKGAWLGALVALVVLGLALRRRVRWAVPLLGLAAVAAALALVLGLGFGVERLNPLGGSSGARVELWTAALRMLRDHPLTGVGLDQFYHYRNAPEFGDRYIAPAARATTEQFAAHPHNLVLDLLVRTGPLGLAAMAWLLVRFGRLARRRLRATGPAAALALGLAASMAAAVAHGLVDNFYFVPDLAVAFWLTIALLESTDVEQRAAEAAEGTSATPPPGIRSA